MKIVTTKCTNTIPLGRLGENDYTLVRFDVSGWLVEYPDAVIGLYNQRPGDNSAYPVADLTVNNGVAEWQITNVELTRTGQGKCQLVAIKDSVVIKSIIYGTIILDALDESGDVPDPWDSWEDRFIELKGEAEQAASDAESAKDQILGMRAQAITLAPGSEATANYDDGVLTLGIPQGEQGAPGQDGAPGAKGDKGDKGDTGATGAQGQKGEKGDKGDKGDTGDQGQKGDKGDPGDPTELIDDNAGAGVTDKVWSASKSAGEVSDLLSAISSMNPAATASDVGKALLVKTVEDGKPTSWEYGEAGGGSVDPQDIAEAVDSWCDANITNPDSPPLDRSLTSSSAAAPADMVGVLSDAVKVLEYDLDTNGMSATVPDVVNGAWSNVDVGGTITPATNNNARRVIVDLSAYIGWEAEIGLATSINPQTTNGTTIYLANSEAVAAVKFYEKVFVNGATYKYTVTAQNAYAYLCYATARSSTNFTAKVTSPDAIQFAKINTLEAEMETSVKPLSFPNLCENANIDDSTGFTCNGVASISVSDHVLTLTMTANNAELNYTVPSAPIASHKYYCAIDMKTDLTGNNTSLQLKEYKSGSATNSLGTVKYNGSNAGEWQRLSFVCTTGVTSGYTAIRLQARTSSWSADKPIYVRKYVIIDLTAVFGSGNEPDVGTVDTILAAYTSGTAFFEGTLQTDVITNSIYPDPGAEKPIFVGISGYVMNVNAKYSATQDIRYKVGKAGSNELFNWRGFDFIDNSTGVVSPKVDLTQNITVITDWFGPHKLKAAANADGDMPDSDNFTGGNHAYNGDSSGTPTARTASYAYYVDGRKVTSFLGYAYYVDVYWQNYVQATNTKKADGTGREVLKETFHMHFDGEKWTLDGMLEPLEALSSWSYYGIQMSRASAYNGYIFYHDSPDNRTWHSTSSSSGSGTNACHTITMHDGADYFEMHVGPDGLGNFALIGNENSFFSTDNKTYSNLIKAATNIAANSIYTYDGYYKWYNKDFN